MVDEGAFRQELQATVALACPFGKAILARCCACELAQQRAIAERETVHCAQQAQREQCHALHGWLQRNSMFALRRIDPAQPLTHAQHMKIQCGGLHGLQREFDEAEEVRDVAALVAAACQRFGSLEQWPSARIVQAIAAFRLRQPHDK